jgi:arylsulfatase A-like enzyme
VYKFAIASIEKKLDKPVFLYIGTIDTHVSWIGKEPWFSKYDPAPYEGKYQKSISGTEVEELAAKKITPNERDRTRVVAMYDSNVSYQDDLLNQLLEQLKTWGVAEDTMIVVTADHGDEQWEDGRVGHGSSTKETLVHVPLMFYYPPLFPGGLIPEGADAGVDILPTIMDALGQPIPEQFQGESLLPLAQGVGRGYPRPTITSQYEFAHAMKMAGWKVRVGGNGVPTLFDIGKDHLETKDLAAEKPMERRFMTDTLSTFLVYQKKWKKWKWGVPSNALPAFADEVETL